MAAVKSRAGFAATELGLEIRRKLQMMAEDAAFNTTSTYSTNATLYTDNLIPFVDKHMKYLIDHPQLEPEKYLANVRLVTRVR